jgi:hypothetical protein
MTQNFEISAMIWRQLGAGRFVVMTGMAQYRATESGAEFKVGKNAMGVNFCRITLTPADLYDIEYGFLRAGKFTVKHTSTDVYADQLRADFEAHTGLRTSL